MNRNRPHVFPLVSTRRPPSSSPRSIFSMMPLSRRTTSGPGSGLNASFSSSTSTLNFLNLDLTCGLEARQRVRPCQARPAASLRLGIFLGLLGLDDPHGVVVDGL